MVNETIRLQQPIRLICLDLDGTLLDSKFQLRPAVREALHRAHEAGIAIAIVTGRNLYSIQSIIEALNLDVQLITCSGSHIRTVDGRTREIDLPSAQVRDIVELALGADSALFLDRPGRSWAIGNEELFQRHAILTTDVFTTDIEMALNSRPLKLYVINEPEVLSRIRQEICDRHPELVLAYSFPTVLDIAHPNATKGTAIRSLSEMIGVSLCEIAALGDSENDLSMFRESALSIAMGNAVPALKAIADFVAPSNDDDGVAWAVDQIIASEFKSQRSRD